MIILHRPSLKDGGVRGNVANHYCRESAKTIASLLARYQKHFDNSVVDFMVIHSACTAALVHLVLLEHPQVASYHSSIRGLRIIIDTLKWAKPRSEYAQSVYEDVRNFAMAWGISPANSTAFWDDTP